MKQLRTFTMLFLSILCCLFVSGAEFSSSANEAAGVPIDAPFGASFDASFGTPFSAPLSSWDEEGSTDSPFVASAPATFPRQSEEASSSWEGFSSTVLWEGEEAAYEDPSFSLVEETMLDKEETEGGDLDVQRSEGGDTSATLRKEGEDTSGALKKEGEDTSGALRTEGEEDQSIDPSALYDLLDQAAADAEGSALLDEWFAKEEEGIDPGEGKGNAEITSTEAPGMTPLPTLVPTQAPVTTTPTPKPAPSSTPLPSNTPLPRPSFTVIKEALQKSAKPGDTVLYTIRIKNTGNVTLHSVVSTEKFTGAGVKAYFEQQEGILLNATHTQAMISEIAPGEEVVLSAYVIIPTKASAQELLNQVEVTTDETGPTITTGEEIIPLLPAEDSSSPVRTIPQGDTYI